MEPKGIVYDICQHYINDHSQYVDPALVAKCDGLRRSRNLAGLASCSCHFDEAKHTVADWKFLRQVEAFFKKNADFAVPEHCLAAALASFVDAEGTCSKTNIRLKTYVCRPHLLDESLRLYVTRMTRYISSVLGDFSQFLDELPYLVKVTPGATSTSSRRESLPQMKMRMRVFATRRSKKYLDYVYRFHGFRLPRIKATPSNRVELVPKNWKTDRTIACEPEGNLPLQLAFDTYAKRRLRRFGINLSDQSANQRLAKHASIHDDFVTVDFSAASDTISYNTVSMVFPPDWLAYLDDVRTPLYRGIFGEGVYSKFSSMGNGSTFAIQTLIFAGACHAVGSNSFLVYGDDVIIAKEYYEEFMRLTGFLGFTVNVEKSFASGPFRESCGGDYFHGVDVTPVYIRGIDRRKATLCHLFNTVMGLCVPDGALVRYLEQLKALHSLPYVPYQENTIAGVWIHPRDARILRVLRRHGGYQNWRCKSYVAKCRTRPFVDARGYYLWFLYRNSQVLFSKPWYLADSQPTEHQQTSSAPIFDHTYVRKWVSWRQPAGGMPDYLYWWSVT